MASGMVYIVLKGKVDLILCDENVFEFENVYSLELKSTCMAPNRALKTKQFKNVFVVDVCPYACH